MNGAERKMVRGQWYDTASAVSKRCHCHGCTRVATRFVGSKKHGWLRFCSVPEHKEAAFAYNEYLRLHPNAR